MFPYPCVIFFVLQVSMSDAQLQAHVMHLRARLDDKDVELRTLRADVKNGEALVNSLRSEINARQLDKEIRMSSLEQQVRSLTAEKETLSRQLALGRCLSLPFFTPINSSHCICSADGSVSVDVGHVMLHTQLEQMSLELRQVTQQNQSLAAQIERLNRERTDLHHQQQNALKEVSFICVVFPQCYPRCAYIVRSASNTRLHWMLPVRTSVCWKTSTRTCDPR